MSLPSEDQEQSWLVAWYRLQYKNSLMFAIPNGGHRHKSTGMLLKATGVVAGVPDLFIPEPRGVYHGLFIEMKKAKGGRLSPEQRVWLASLSDRGYKAVMCEGFEAAKSVITEYMEV